MTRGRQTLALPPETISVTRARHWVAEHLERAGWPAAARHDAELCVSELAANAVAHAGTDLVIEIAHGDDRLRITVSDLDDRVPQPSEPAFDTPTGRGLLLVASVASRWGVVPSAPHGKSVWCEIPFPG